MSRPYKAAEQQQSVPNGKARNRNGKAHGRISKHWRMDRAKVLWSQQQVLTEAMRGKLKCLVLLADIEIEADIHRSAPKFAPIHALLADQSKLTPIRYRTQDNVTHILHAKALLYDWAKEGKTVEDKMFEIFLTQNYKVCWEEAKAKIAEEIPGTIAQRDEQATQIMEDIIGWDYKEMREARYIKRYHSLA